MALKYRVILALVAISAVAIGILAYYDVDLNLKVARAIYAKMSGQGVSYEIAEDILDKKLTQLPDRVREARKRGKAAYDNEVLRAYFTIVSSNKVEADGVILELMDILIENGDAKMLLEFMKIANHSEDLMLRVYQCAENEELRRYFTHKLGMDLFKNSEYKKIGYAIIRLNMDMAKRSISDIEKTFLYSGLDFGMLWNVGAKNYIRYAYPLMAYVSKSKGLTDKYEYFKSQSISDAQMERIKGSFFEYIQYAVKVFARCSDPETAVSLLERLPDGSRKNLTIKRTIRYILKSPGGREAIEKSKIGNLLKE